MLLNFPQLPLHIGGISWYKHKYQVVISVYITINISIIIKAYRHVEILTIVTKVEEREFSVSNSRKFFVMALPITIIIKIVNLN